MKKFMLMTVAAFCMFLAACSGGGAPSPTGDVTKDAKAVLDYSIEMMSNIKDEASIKDFETKMEALQKEFDAYYKDPEAKAKFEEEGKKEKDRISISSVKNTDSISEDTINLTKL